MTTSPRGAARRSAWVALAALAAALPTSAQDQAAEHPPAGPFKADGTELFRGLLAVEGVTPVGSVRQADVQDPASLILVLFGRPGAARGAAELSARLVQGGGAVLILSEEAGDLIPFLPTGSVFRLESTGRRVYCPDRTKCLDGNGWMPFLEPAVGRMGPPVEAALLEGLDRIATNVPSNLRLVRQRGPNTLRGIATFPEGTRYARAGAGQPGEPLRQAVDPQPLPEYPTIDDDRFFAAAAGGLGGTAGKFLVLADPSVFINQMLAHSPAGGTDNLAFALRVVQWLKGSDGGPRTRCLFLESGTVRGSFADAGFSPRPAPPVPPVPRLDPLNPKFQAAITDAGDKAIIRAEDNDWFNRVLAGVPETDRRFATTLRLLAALVAAGAVVWLVLWARGARHATDVPGASRSGLPPVPPAGTVARRQAELIRGGLLTGPVREVVAGLFAAAGLPAGVKGGPAPVVETAGPDADGLAREVRAVWDAVLGPAAKPVTPARWKELEPMIDAVRQAADTGRWRVAPAGGPS